MESGIDKLRKMSFGFSLGDERIKLIDIVSEDDHFLVASPFSDSGRTDHFGEQQALFRLSGFGCSQDVETFQQTVHNRAPGDATEVRRPSYLRRSLAWDSAFNNSAGVLDPDELSLINKGFGADSHLLPDTHGVRKRRPESEIPLLNDGSSLDWFEIEPFEKKRPATYRSNSVKGFNTASMSLDLGSRDERLRNSRALGKEEDSSRNKVSSQTAVRKSMSLHTEDMKKLLKETTDRSQIRASSSSSSSVKPPRSWCRSVNDSTTSNRTDIPGKSNVKMTRFGPGKSTNSIRQSGVRSETSSTDSIPFTAASPSRASFSTSKRITETEPRQSKVYAAVSTSKIMRGSEKSTGTGNETSHSTHTKSQLKRPTFSSPASYSSQYSSQSLSSSLSKKRKSNVDTKTTNLGPDSSSKEAAETSSVGSHTVKIFKPSELRPPSPKMGFFDEATGSRGTRRKTHQNVESEGTFLGTKTQHHSSEVLPNSSISSGLSSTCNKLRSGILDTARKIKRSTTYLSKDKEKLAETLKVSDGKRSRNRVGFNSSTDQEDKRKDSLKNKRYKGSTGPVIEDLNNTIKKRNGQNVLNGSEDRIGNLSRFFEAIALDQDRNKQPGQKNKTGNKPIARDQDRNEQLRQKNKTGYKAIPVFSKQVNQLINSPTRTPLADKSSVCNSNQPRSLPLVP